MKIKKQFNNMLLITLCANAITVIADPTIADTVFADSRPLHRVESVVDALNLGATVNATVDLSLCVRQGGGATAQTRGGLRVSPFRVQENGTLSFSDSHFTVSTRSGVAVPITQFLRYSVAPEGAITVTSFIFSMPDYNLTSEVAFDCSINNGVNFYVPR